MQNELITTGTEPDKGLQLAVTDFWLAGKLSKRALNKTILVGMVIIHVEILDRDRYAENSIVITQLYEFENAKSL